MTHIVDGFIKSVKRIFVLRIKKLSLCVQKAKNVFVNRQNHNKILLMLKSSFIAFVIAVIYSVIPFQSECAEIPDDVFRLHIIANSDFDFDQQLKLKVRDRILEHTKEMFSKAKSKEDSEKIIAENLQNIADIAKEEICLNGYDYPVKAEITNMYFTTRYYDDYTLPSGMYDALRITIGEGKGRNWWCVMYPSICISSVESDEEKVKEALDEEEYSIIKDEQYQYKFLIVEWFEKICSFFEND